MVTRADRNATCGRVGSADGVSAIVPDLTPAMFAPPRLALVSVAPPRLALARLAFVRLVFVSAAPARLALGRLAFVRLAPGPTR